MAGTSPAMTRRSRDALAPEAWVRTPSAQEGGWSAARRCICFASANKCTQFATLEAGRGARKPPGTRLTALHRGAFSARAALFVRRPLVAASPSASSSHRPLVAGGGVPGRPECAARTAPAGATSNRSRVYPTSIPFRRSISETPLEDAPHERGREEYSPISGSADSGSRDCDLSPRTSDNRRFSASRIAKPAAQHDECAGFRPYRR